MTDLSSTASTINAAMDDPLPKVDPPRDCVVELLRGLPSDGGYDRHAIVREMNGSDEEYLASLETRTTLSYPEYISAMLKRTVVSIGDTEIAKKPDVIDDLIIGDRDTLFVAVVKATYGNVRTYTVTCGGCKVSSDLNINLDEDFEVQGTHEEAIAPIKVEMRDGTTLSLRLPNGGDTKYVSKKGKSNAEQNTLMISRCADVKVPNREIWARNLSIADRSKIINALLNVQLGPKAGEVHDPCPHCGEMIHVSLDWVSLLFG